MLPPQGGLPPGLLAMLAHGTPATGPGPALPPPPQGSDTDDVAAIREAEQAVQRAIIACKDDEDKAALSDILNRLHKVLAQEQSERDQVMGGNKAITRVMRKAG